MVRLRKQTLGVLAFFFALAATSPLWGDCPQNLAKLGTVQPWSNQEKNLRLTARDLFPEDYVAQVESAFGHFDVRVAHYPLRGFLSISGIVKNRPYVRVKLFEDPDHVGSMIVDDLSLEDPLRRADPSQLHADQSGKGLPPSVFKHVKERLFEIVKSGGYKEIRTHSQQHFGVVQLYKRFVGMEPANDRSKVTLDFLEGLYSFARKELPEELRPKDVEEFTRWLGSGGLDPAGLTPKREKVLQAYFSQGIVDSSFTLLKNKKGDIIGALFNDQERAKSNIIFFDLTEQKPAILHWLKIATSHQLELIRKL